MDYIIFIEGTTDDTNGNLKKGFSLLFEKKLKGKMPRIIMGDDQVATTRKFLNYASKGKKALLIDSDLPNANREDVILKLGLKDEKDNVFLMVQEMEAWFLSQTEMLDNYFKSNVSKRIPAKHASNIPDPSDFLADITKDSRKGKYHKVKDGASILPLLDTEMLSTDFKDDFHRLMKIFKG